MVKISINGKTLPAGKKFFVPLQKSKIHCVLLKPTNFKLTSTHDRF